MGYIAVLTAFLCLLLFHVTDCDKFIVFMAQSRSHVYPILPVMKKLEKYNHNATLVLSSSMKNHLLSDGINASFVLAKSFDQTTIIDHIGAVLESKMLGRSKIPHVKLLYALFKESNAFCHNLMADEELYQTLKNENYDYAIIDFSPFLCFDVLAYKLSLPFLFFGAHYDLILNRSPINPSFMPAFFTAFTDKMTFLQRVLNLLFYTTQLIKPSMPAYENLVERYVPERPMVTNDELRKSALLHIIDGDILMDYAVSLPPNIILCGGLAASAAKPLPDFIEYFIKHAIDGVVIISFGSVIKTLPEIIVLKLMNTFQNMKDLRFIIRYGKERHVDGNVLRLPWIPQNDLVGHPKTRLLITHCGKSSILEALYHGIPMIGFPMGLDQPQHAEIIKNKGYGIQMDIHDFVTEQLETNINQVVFTEFYRANIEKASKIFHSRPQIPSQKAAYWIDLVTKYGHDHFRSSALDMHWFSYYLIDVLLFYNTIFFVFLFLIRKCFRFCKMTDTKQKTD